MKILRVHSLILSLSISLVTWLFVWMSHKKSICNTENGDDSQRKTCRDNGRVEKSKSV